MLPAVRRAGEWRGEAMGTLVGNSLGPCNILEQLGASMSPTSLGTVAGRLMGTAAYVSPEQAHGERRLERDPRDVQLSHADVAAIYDLEEQAILGAATPARSRA